MTWQPVGQGGGNSQMIATVLLEWWMWFCQNSDPVKQSGLSRSSSEYWTLVLWESSGSAPVVFPNSYCIQVGMLGSSPRRGISKWNDVILWVMLGDLDVPLAEIAPQRELSGMSNGKDKKHGPTY